MLAHLTTLDAFITLRALTPKNQMQQHMSSQVPPAQTQAQKALPVQSSDSVGSNNINININSNSNNNNNSSNGRTGTSPGMYAPANSYGGPSAIPAADIEQLLQLRGVEAPLNTSNANSNSAPAGGYWENFQSQNNPHAAASVSSSVASSRSGSAAPTADAAALQGTPNPNNGCWNSGTNNTANATNTMYEQSDVRMVFTDKTVTALVGADKCETLLGFATFGSAEGVLRFVSFYILCSL